MHVVSNHVLYIKFMNAPRSLVFVAVDFIAAMLIRSTGHTLQIEHNKSLKALDLRKSVNDPGKSCQLTVLY